MSTNYGDIFNSGFDRGAALVNQWDENRRRKAVRQGMAGLDSTTTTAPTAAQTTEFNSANAGLAAEDNRTFGTANTAADYQYGEAKLTEPRGLGDVERNRRAEQLHRAQGFDRAAERYGERADTAKRQEGLDARQAKTDARADGNQRLQDRLTQATAEGKTLSVPEIAQLAQETGGDSLAAMEQVAKQQGITADVAQAQVEKSVRAIGQAVASGLPAVNEYARTSMDPDPTDNAVPNVVETADGFVVMYGNKPMPGMAPAYGSLQELAAELISRAKGDPYGYTMYKQSVEKRQQEQADRLLKNDHTRATTRSANASADNAGKGGVTINMGSTPQDMTGGGQGVVVTNKGRGTAGLVPLAGSPNRVTTANNALAGVTLVVPSPTADNPNPRPYLARDGRKISAANPSTSDEYKAIQQQMETLRQAGQPMPWARKQPQPGLR